MGSCTASPTLLKTWFSYLLSSARGCLRLFALSSAFLTLYLELSSSNPTTTALILLRLSRRLRLLTSVCTLTKDEEHDMTSSASIQGAKALDRPERTITRKRSTSLPRLQENASGAGQHPPQPDAGDSDSSSSSTTLSHPSPSPSMPSHARSKTTSHADIVRQGKRLSLQFPIQPTAGSSSPVFSPRSRPQSWIAAPSPLLSPEPQPSSPETNILAVLAAQERYVLELKEELGKAEEDLKTLKKHYALHEANKRRNDVRKVAQLQPLNTTLANIDAAQDDEDGGNLWMQREMERRKALLSNTKSSQRKVFSGSRHLRTLSLLSPDRAYAPSFPQSARAYDDDSTSTRPSMSIRSSTSSDVSRQLIDVTSSDRNDLNGLSNMQRDNLLRTGKQLASDFSNGLFTFIEDIRQATVGDEAVNGAAEPSGPSQSRDGSAKVIRNTSASRPSLNRSASSRKSVQKKQSIGEDFWSEHGLSEPKTTSVNKKTHAPKASRTPERQTARNSDSFDEEWDNWDSPGTSYVAKTTDTHNDSDESDAVDPQATIKQHPRRHDSKNSSLATISSASMPETSASRDSKRNSIPWPDLVNLSPSNLKRTASHLMKEWEKQLTPPPESRLSSHTQGDYIGRSGPGSLI
ncbi:hypothetical protein SVAN01_05923 [Stagonosporopsis vannaccii]|nr:hypothetical protein SVAN01_05923 [Stagonosporopsis vannaccii]